MSSSRARRCPKRESGAPAVAADDPPRVRHHGADRSGARIPIGIGLAALFDRAISGGVPLAVPWGRSPSSLSQRSSSGSSRRSSPRLARRASRVAPEHTRSPPVRVTPAQIPLPPARGHFPRPVRPASNRERRSRAGSRSRCRSGNVASSVERILGSAPFRRQRWPSQPGRGIRERVRRHTHRRIPWLAVRNAQRTTDAGGPALRHHAAWRLARYSGISLRRC